MRSLSVLVLAHSFLFACGGASAQSKRAMPASALAGAPTQVSATANQAATPPPRDQALVITGTVNVSVREISGALATIRAQIKSGQGRIVTERESGAGLSWSANLSVRLPPANVDALLETLASLGEVTRKNITADDVSKKLFDQEIALANLTATLERMRALLATPNMKMAEILEIEREMTRLRGAIEAIKGEQRYLVDRVALATITINLSRDGGAVVGPRAKLLPGPRLSTLILFRPGNRQRVRFGAGATIGLPIARISYDLDVFSRADDESSASMMLTAGASMVSDFLGRGQRRFLNPTIGFRAGYGYLEGSRFVAAAELGLELFKSDRLRIDANVRATALVGNETDVALVSGLGAVVAF